MPAQVNSNYGANFQKFVDFANKAYAAHAENTVVRFTGMPKGDYKGAFASLFRTNDMKTANDQVRNLFLKTVADMFGGERNIPDIVRDIMKLDDFGKGKPLTARRIMLVKNAIDIAGGGMFERSSSVDKATRAGYLPHEMAKLARVATIYRNATGCTEAEAEDAALDPSSKARRLYDYGGRFVKNADAFKAGLALMDKFDAWYGDLMGDSEAKARDTMTKLNLNFSVCTREAGAAVQKFVFEEIAVNGKLPLDAKNPEDLFGMAKNPAMRFVGRGYTTSFTNSLAQIPPEKREVIYAVFDVLDKLPANAGELAKRDKVGYSLLAASRVMKNFDAVAALQASGKLDRANLVPILYPDLEVSPDDSNRQISSAYELRVARNPVIMPTLHMLAENSGATLDEVDAAISSGTRLGNAPGISSFSGKLEELDGTARGGRKTMIYDLVRPTAPNLTENEKPALADEDVKFVFNFPDGETIDTITGSLDEPDVRSRCDAVADKIADLCGNVHPKQLSNVYFALSQSAIGVNVNGGFTSVGVSSDEHMPVTFSLARNDETGAVTIRYSEPKGFPVKFNWTTTIDVDGNAVTTPMRIDHGQYEAKAMTFAEQIESYVPSKDKAVAEGIIKEMLAHCGDDFELKDIVSQSISGLCITGAAKLRTMDQIKARIDAVRANLEEVRRAAAGSTAIENAGVCLLSGLNGKSLPAGAIARMVKATSAEKAGEFANLTANSTPQQITKAVVDMRKAVENAMHNSYVQDYLEGSDEMDPAREFAFLILIGKFSKAQLEAANAALRSETTKKLFAVLDEFKNRQYPAAFDARRINVETASWIEDECQAIETLSNNYTLSLERLLGKQVGGTIKEFNGEFDKAAFGSRDILNMIVPLAEKDIAAYNEDQRRLEYVKDAGRIAKTKAGHAYDKAGDGNAEKVDKLIKIALKHCAESEDAVRIVADNIDLVLVSNSASLRSLEQVRERAKAVAANFRELKELSKDNPAIYEAGKRMMTSLRGKSLPPGMITQILTEAFNVKVDAIRKLSSRSSSMEIHRAVTQLRDNLKHIMDSTGAELAAGGPDEKQACRNFLAAVMMDRCGARALREMKGAFEGDLPSKMQAFYMAVGNGLLNKDLGLEGEKAFKLEDEATSHTTHIGALKVAIDLAADGVPGPGLAVFKEPVDADEFGGPEIVEDLMDLASV